MPEVNLNSDALRDGLRAQAGVVVWFGPTFLDRDVDLTANFGKGFGHSGPAFHFCCFAVFKCTSQGLKYLLGGKYSKGGRE